jgi:Tol biopolymer transport system component
MNASKLGRVIPVLVAGILSSLPISAHAQSEPDSIIFSSNRGGSFDLWVVKEDGTGARQLTTHPLDELQPDISPDGSRIVFVRTEGISCCGPHMDLYLSNIDGSGERPLLVDTSLDDYRPEWSPDGTRILFSRTAITSGGSGAGGNLFVINADGSGLRQVTSDAVGVNYSSWSPDGKRIVLVSSRDGRTRLWIVDADGSGLRALTEGPAGTGDFVPSWGPEDRISYHSSRDSSFSEIYTIAPDGSDLRRLTSNTFVDRHAAWSPDGRKIAFSGLRDLPCSAVPTSLQPCPGQLYTMNSDGSSQMRLLAPPFHDAFPVYLPRVSDRAMSLDASGVPSPRASDLAATGSSVPKLGAVLLLAAVGFFLLEGGFARRKSMSHC